MPVIVVLHGADALGMQRHIARLKAQVGATREEIETNTAVFDGKDVKPQEILGAAMVPPFLAAQRLVIVERLLDRFEQGPGGRGSRSLGPFGGFVDEIGAGLPPTTVLVVTGGAVSKDKRRENPLLAKLKKLDGCEVAEYPELKGQALERHIREEANVRGIKLRQGPSTHQYAEGEEWRRPNETDPAALLAALHPGDTLSLANELDKLALYTRGREATVDDVALVCAGQRAYNIFNFTDAVLDGDYELARKACIALLEEGESEQGLIAMLAGGYRRMAPAVELLAQGADDDALANAIPGGKYPNLFKRAKDRAVRHGFPGLIAGYEAIVEADRMVKSGEMDQGLALEVLIARLSNIAPARSRQRQRARTA